MATASFPDNVSIAGDLTLVGNISPTKTRANLLAVADLQAFEIPWTAWRVWDAMHTNLPGTAANDDLALVGGTFATMTPSIQALDVGGTTTTARARAQIALPWEYATGQDVQLRFFAGIDDTVADDSCTLDVECYESIGLDGTIGSDLYAGAAVNINVTTFANADFALTATALAPGDILDIRITIAATDAGHLGQMIPGISKAWLLCDVR